jgi:thiol-disulfide isomerase/thioredoxin
VPAVLVLVGLLAVAAGIAIVATADDDQTGSVATASVEVVGDPLPAYQAGPDGAVGLRAPTLAGRAFSGAPAVIENDGRPKAILFLAHWCSHCQAEVPLVQAWLDERGAPAGVDLFSVATADDPARPNYPADAWLEAEGWTIPVLVDDQVQSAAMAFGLTSFPYFVFLDGDGKVVARVAGELPIDELEAYLASVTR